MATPNFCWKEYNISKLGFVRARDYAGGITPQTPDQGMMPWTCHCGIDLIDQESEVSAVTFKADSKEFYAHVAFGHGVLRTPGRMQSIR